MCRSGEVLQGLIKPHECSAFGTLCTPRNPLGATMVSSEGACAAYYLYRRLETPAEVVRPVAEQVMLPDPSMPDPPNFDGWTCPLPLRDHPRVVMGHGGGGQMSGELVEHLFLPAFANPVLGGLTDSAVFTLGERPAGVLDRLVRGPAAVLPGRQHRHLAVNGTVNDLAMSGAQAAYLSCGFILEEGVELSVVGRDRGGPRCGGASGPG